MSRDGSLILSDIRGASRVHFCRPSEAVGGFESGSQTSDRAIRI